MPTQDKVIKIMMMTFLKLTFLLSSASCCLLCKAALVNTLLLLLFFMIEGGGRLVGVVVKGISKASPRETVAVAITQK